MPSAMATASGLKLLKYFISDLSIELKNSGQPRGKAWLTPCGRDKARLKGTTLVGRWFVTPCAYTRTPLRAEDSTRRNPHGAPKGPAQRADDAITATRARR